MHILFLIKNKKNKKKTHDGSALALWIIKVEIRLQ